MPLWDEKDLEGMGYKLRHGIEQSMLLRMIVLRRLRNLGMTAEYAKDYMRPLWVEEEYKKYLADYKKHKRKRKNHAKT